MKEHRYDGEQVRSREMITSLTQHRRKDLRNTRWEKSEENLYCPDKSKSDVKFV